VRIAYPTQACTTCETAGVICTGPTVGRCARCRATRHGSCSNSTRAVKGQASKAPEPKPEPKPKQTKVSLVLNSTHHTLIDVHQRKRDDIAMPALETPERPIPTEVTALPVQQSSPIETPPCTKRQKTDAECSMNRNACSPSPSTSCQVTIEDIRRDLNTFLFQQSQLLQKMMNAQVELQRMALGIQTKIGDIAQKAEDNRAC